MHCAITSCTHPLRIQIVMCIKWMLRMNTVRQMHVGLLFLIIFISTRMYTCTYQVNSKTTASYPLGVCALRIFSGYSLCGCHFLQNEFSWNEHAQTFCEIWLGFCSHIIRTHSAASDRCVPSGIPSDIDPVTEWFWGYSEWRSTVFKYYQVARMCSTICDTLPKQRAYRMLWLTQRDILQWMGILSTPCSWIRYLHVLMLSLQRYIIAPHSRVKAKLGALDFTGKHKLNFERSTRNSKFKSQWNEFKRALGTLTHYVMRLWLDANLHAGRCISTPSVSIPGLYHQLWNALHRCILWTISLFTPAEGIGHDVFFFILCVIELDRKSLIGSWIACCTLYCIRVDVVHVLGFKQ